jgi:hypothetical protein
MHIECGRPHICLTDHYMHLASMMRLVVKEVKDGDRCRLQVILALAICVREWPGEKIAVHLLEERFYARILFAPR